MTGSPTTRLGPVAERASRPARAAARAKRVVRRRVPPQHRRPPVRRRSARPRHARPSRSATVRKPTEPPISGPVISAATSGGTSLRPDAASSGVSALTKRGQYERGQQGGGEAVEEPHARDALWSGDNREALLTRGVVGEQATGATLSRLVRPRAGGGSHRHGRGAARCLRCTQVGVGFPGAHTRPRDHLGRGRARQPARGSRETTTGHEAHHGRHREQRHARVPHGARQPRVGDVTVSDVGSSWRTTVSTDRGVACPGGDRLRQHDPYRRGTP